MGNKTRCLAEVGINTVLCCLVLVPSFAVYVLPSKTLAVQIYLQEQSTLDFQLKSTYVLCWHTVIQCGYYVWRERERGE